eukprot:829589-Pelagomonas_calceolata.AAC.3
MVRARAMPSIRATGVSCSAGKRNAEIVMKSCGVRSVMCRRIQDSENKQEICAALSTAHVAILAMLWAHDSVIQVDHVHYK